MADSDWRNVDIETLSAGERSAWDAMKEAYRAYNATKTTFQDVFSERFAGQLPDNLELKFGYNFGKLSIAVGPKRERKTTRAESTQSLGDWLAAQAAGGRQS